MNIRTILCMALAACSLTVSAHSDRKKTPKKKAPAVVVVPAVPADSFSYAIGTLQSGSLMQYLQQREGIDSTQINTVVRALNDAQTLTPAQVKDRIAYAAGLRIAEMNRTQIVQSLNQSATGKADTTYTDLAIFTKGLCDGLQKKTTLTTEQAEALANRQFEHFKQQLQLTNKAWIEANAKNKDVKTTASGLQYRVVKQGTGACATDSSEVEVHYEGRLIDGSLFDSSYSRNQPATFRADQVIRGWTEALKMMPEGSTYELFIPSELGYGERGNQGIPPYSTLIFKVEVLKVKSNPAPAKSK